MVQSAAYALGDVVGPGMVDHPRHPGAALRRVARTASTGRVVASAAAWPVLRSHTGRAATPTPPARFSPRSCQRSRGARPHFVRLRLAQGAPHRLHKGRFPSSTWTRDRSFFVPPGRRRASRRGAPRARRPRAMRRDESPLTYPDRSPPANCGARLPPKRSNPSFLHAANPVPGFYVHGMFLPTGVFAVSFLLTPLQISALSKLSNPAGPMVATITQMASAEYYLESQRSFRHPNEYYTAGEEPDGTWFNPHGLFGIGGRGQDRQRGLPPALQWIFTGRDGQADPQRWVRDAVSGARHDVLGGQEHLRALGDCRARYAGGDRSHGGGGGSGGAGRHGAPLLQLYADHRGRRDCPRPGGPDGRHLPAWHQPGERSPASCPLHGPKRRPHPWGRQVPGPSSTSRLWLEQGGGGLVPGLPGVGPATMPRCQDGALRAERRLYADRGHAGRSAVLLVKAPQGDYRQGGGTGHPGARQRPALGGGEQADPVRQVPRQRPRGPPPALAGGS